MALKVLQITGAAAVVVLMIFIIPVLIRLRKTADELAEIVSETRPYAVALLKKAQDTMDSVNSELDNIEKVTAETKVLVERMGQATEAIKKAANSPMAKAGFISTGAAAMTIAVRRRISQRESHRK